MNGEEVHLCIGGVRSLNEENLYARKSPEKFKIFIGWRVKVCSNLMLLNDGLTGRLEVMSDADIYSSALRLFQDFNPEQNLRLLENLGRTNISQEQFCQIIDSLVLRLSSSFFLVNAPGTLPRILCDTLISVFPKLSPVK